MYFPYLRGKQHEISAVLQLGTFLAETNNTCPIIEPVKIEAGRAPYGKFAEIAEFGFPLAVVENPEFGDHREDNSALRGVLLAGVLAPFDNVIPTLRVGPGTPYSAVREFSQRWSNKGIGLVHQGAMPTPDRAAALLRSRPVFQAFRRDRTSAGYRDLFSVGRPVVLIDSYNRMPRNATYPPKEFFSDVLRSHQSEGFGGFGDFLIVGDHFAESGGQALAVAIHWTNLEEENLWLYHFLSDRTEGRGVDTPGKFFEALSKLCRFIRSQHNALLSQGARDFLELMRARHFPGLGMVKRYSMKHHIELIASTIPGNS